MEQILEEEEDEDILSDEEQDQGNQVQILPNVQIVENHIGAEMDEAEM